MKTMILIYQIWFDFKGVLGRDYKPDFFDVRLIENVVGYNKMSYMNGIKGAEI